MKLDRNEGVEGRGKYALLKLRSLENFRGPGPFADVDPEIVNAIQLLESEGLLDWGAVNTESEFFVIRLKDRNAKAALMAYAESVREKDGEFADEVVDLALRAGDYSPFCKDPD